MTGIETAPNATKVRTVLEKAHVFTTTKQHSGQIRGVASYNEGFELSYGGTKEYRCARCGKKDIHTDTCRRRRGAPRWRENLISDGTLVLRWHVSSYGRRTFEENTARREAAMTKAYDALVAAGFTVEVKSVDTDIQNVLIVR